MKKVISGILAVLILMLGAVSAYAAAPVEAEVNQPQTRLSYINMTTTTLGISGGQAICDGCVIGYYGTTTKVKIELYLERKLATASTWSPYADGSKTVDYYMAGYEMPVAVVKGYQYRVRAVYTAWAGKNSEMLTSYSGTVAY